MVLKKTVKLGLAIIALVLVLVATGYLNLTLNGKTKLTIYNVASQTAPAVLSQASSIASILPITSAAFLIGLAIGVWKG